MQSLAGSVQRSSDCTEGEAVVGPLSIFIVEEPVSLQQAKSETPSALFMQASHPAGMANPGISYSFFFLWSSRRFCNKTCSRTDPQNKKLCFVSAVAIPTSVIKELPAQQTIDLKVLKVSVWDRLLAKRTGSPQHSVYKAINRFYSTDKHRPIPLRVH